MMYVMCSGAALFFLTNDVHNYNMHIIGPFLAFFRI